METKKILAAMEDYNQKNADSSYAKFVYGEALTEKLRKNATEKIAPGVQKEEIIGVFDTSITGSAKSGLVITLGQVCSKKLKNGPIELDGLRFVSQVDGTPDRICFLYENGLLRDTTVSENSELRKMRQFFERLCPYTAAIEPPKKEWEELHHKKGRILRKKIEEAALLSEMSAENLYLRGSMDEVLLEKFCQCCHGAVEESEIIFYNGLVSGTLGFVVTETGMYNGKTTICFDGLIRIYEPVNHQYRKLAVYENGYIQEVFFESVEKVETIELFLNRVAEIFRDQKQKELQNEGKNISLSAVEGWEQFQEMQRKRIPDAAQNTIFISSTFRDMHYERDKIHDDILPKLNQAGEAYGCDVSVCDLRWGVNTGKMDEEESARKVLTVCLDEIERCKPYMVIVLGERYGWIPGKEALEDAVAGRPELALEELEKSVTELEIEFGALAEADSLEHVFFYFRTFRGEPSAVYQSEDKLHAEKLAKLKARIQKLAGKEVRTYELVWQGEDKEPLGLDKFSNQVFSDLKEEMQKEWQKTANWTKERKEAEAHWKLAERRAGMCSARDQYIQECMELLEDKKTLLAVTGMSGSGKSTVMGCLAVVERLQGKQVLPIFCGYTNRSQTGLDIIKKITGFLSQCLGEEEKVMAEGSAPEQWQTRMEMLIERCTERGISVLIILDAVDQLIPDSICEKQKFVPRNLSSHVQMVLSTLTGEKLPYLAEELPLPQLEKKDRMKMICGNLKIYRRELENCVVEAIAEKKGAEQPLYVSLLTQRLLQMNRSDFEDISEKGDGLSAISAHQIQLIKESPDSIEGMCTALIESAAQKVGKEFAMMAAACISLSRHGLRDKDLEGILTRMGIGWNGLDFSLFFHSVRSMFQVRSDGRYDISHAAVRRGVKNTIKDHKRMHGEIAEWLKSLPSTDSMRVQELPYHSLYGGKIELFMTYLHEYKDVKTAIKEASHLLAEYCSSDREVVAAMIAHAVKEHDFVILHFLAYEFYFATNDDDILREYLHAGEKAAEAIADEAKTLEEKRLPGVFLSRQGSYWRWNGQTEKALDYKKQSLEYTRSLLQRQEEDVLWNDLCIDLRDVAGLYLKQFEQLETARIYCEESLKTIEKCKDASTVASVHKMNSLYYQKCGQKTQAVEQGELRISCLENALQNAVKEGEPTEKVRRNLANACNDLAFLYLEYETEFDSRDRSKALFLQELGLREELVREEETPGDLQKLAYSEAVLADMLKEESEKLLEKDKQSEVQEQALELYERSMYIFEILQKAGKGEENKKRMALLCRNAAKLYLQTGKAMYKEKCRKYALLAVKFDEEVVRKEPVIGKYRDLKHSLLLAQKVDVSNSIRHIERCMEVCEWLYQHGERKEKKSIRELKVLKNVTSVVNKC